MEILEKKDLETALSPLKRAITKLSEQSKEETTTRKQIAKDHKELLYKLVEIKGNEKEPLVVDRKEAMRLLGGISLWKIDQLIQIKALNPIQLGGEGRKMFRVAELEELTVR